MNRIDIGLDQTVALPHYSYLGDYYRDIFSQLRVGPPVYFVFHNKGNIVIRSFSAVVFPQSFAFSRKQVFARFQIQSRAYHVFLDILDSNLEDFQIFSYLLDSVFNTLSVQETHGRGSQSE